MNASDRAEIKVYIEDQLQKVSEELINYTKQLQPIAPECALGTLLRAEMMVKQEVLERAYSVLKKRNIALNSALKRLDEETFGNCLICDEVISLARLKLIPESLYCIRCAKEQEI